MIVCKVRGRARRGLAIPHAGSATAFHRVVVHVIRPGRNVAPDCNTGIKINSRVVDHVVIHIRGAGRAVGVAHCKDRGTPSAASVTHDVVGNHQNTTGERVLRKHHVAMIARGGHVVIFDQVAVDDIKDSIHPVVNVTDDIITDDITMQNPTHEVFVRIVGSINNIVMEIATPPSSSTPVVGYCVRIGSAAPGCSGPPMNVKIRHLVVVGVYSHQVHTTALLVAGELDVVKGYVVAGNPDDISELIGAAG